MERDPDLIRKILLEVEKKGNGTVFVDFTSDEFSKYSQDQIAYHVKLADQRKYIGEWLEDLSGICVLELTDAGHDFLDAVRNDDIWNKAKNGANEAGGWTLDLLKEIAKGYIKTQIKSKTGVDV